jgi:predicted dehydrogenase
MQQKHWIRHPTSVQLPEIRNQFMNSSDIWLVGAGGMAVDYVKVLAAMGVSTTIIGRGEESAQRMQEKCGLPVIAGGLSAFLSTCPAVPRAAIVAVGVEGLALAAKELLDAGVKQVLLEKPGALCFSELQALHEQAKRCSAEVVIGYNRRMYASVLAAQTMIEEDGGVQSMHFEFTEWGHIIEGLTKAPGVKEAWLLANSTHVIDLAFYLGGNPTEIHSLTSGHLAWHPSSAVFTGSGRTDRGALFSYQANWDAPGRWGVEVLTRQRRLVFRPMEMLQIMKRGSVAVEPVIVDDSHEKTFKPGLYRQVEKFLAGDSATGLCSLEEQMVKWSVYEKIAGYDMK